MRKVSDSTQLIRMKREMKSLHQDRQTWAARALRAEKALAKADADVAEWKARFDRILAYGLKREDELTAGREAEGPR